LGKRLFDVGQKMRSEKIRIPNFKKRGEGADTKLRSINNLCEEYRIHMVLYVSS